jgi:hypothetical protein
MEKSVAERQVLRDAVGIGRINDHRTAETAAALGILGLGQVAFAGVAAQNFAAGRNFKTLGHGLFGFDAFGTSHKSKFNRKRARTIRGHPRGGKRLFICPWLKLNHLPLPEA